MRAPQLYVNEAHSSSNIGHGARVLAQAYRVARKFCEPRGISAFVTDAIVCHPAANQRTKLQTALQACLHPDGSQMFKEKIGPCCLVCSSEPPVTPAFEISTQPAQWCDFHEADDNPTLVEAMRIVMEGSSVFLQGFGGTGRTCAAKVIVKELLEQGKAVICTSYTHVPTLHCVAAAYTCVPIFQRLRKVFWFYVPKLIPMCGPSPPVGRQDSSP